MMHFLEHLVTSSGTACKGGDVAEGRKNGMTALGARVVEEQVTQAQGWTQPDAAHDAHRGARQNRQRQEFAAQVSLPPGHRSRTGISLLRSARRCDAVSLAAPSPHEEWKRQEHLSDRLIVISPARPRGRPSDFNPLEAGRAGLRPHRGVRRDSRSSAGASTTSARAPMNCCAMRSTCSLQTASPCSNLRRCSPTPGSARSASRKLRTPKSGSTSNPAMDRRASRCRRPCASRS